MKKFIYTVIGIFTLSSVVFAADRSACPYPSYITVTPSGSCDMEGLFDWTYIDPFTGYKFQSKCAGGRPSQWLGAYLSHAYDAPNEMVRLSCNYLADNGEDDVSYSLHTNVPENCTFAGPCSEQSVAAPGQNKLDQCSLVCSGK